MVTFNSDQFAMFNVASEDAKSAQAKMASAVEDPSFQSAFNVLKGSVPARTDVPNDAFDDCGKKGMADLAEANANGMLFGSMAHGHAAPAAIKNALYDVVTAEFNGEYDAATAATERQRGCRGAVTAEPAGPAPGPADPSACLRGSRPTPREGEGHDRPPAAMAASGC